MRLLEVDIKEFKHIIYPEYVKLFPEAERKSYHRIKKAVKNKISKIRVKFYENLGFYKMNFELELFTVIYSTYLLPGLETENSDEKIINYILKIYTAVLGKNKVKRNCKVMMLR